MSYNPETGMYEGYIYCIENLVNGKKYIGQTIEIIRKRWNRHRSASKSGDQAIYRAMRKYGVENFSISEIKMVECPNKESLLNALNDLEVYYIDKYHTLVTKNGYNETKGGNNIAVFFITPVDQYTLDGVFISNYDSIQSASIATSVSVSSIQKNINHKQKTGGGYIWVKSGEKPDLNTRPSYSKTIYQYTKYGNLVNTYNCVTDAANQLNIDSSGISAVLNKCNRTCQGYIWVDEYHKFIKPTSQYKKIIQYDTFGTCVNIFNTAAEAERITGINSASILESCHGYCCAAGYYIWRFEEDSFDKYPLIPRMTPVATYDDDGNEIARYHFIKEAVNMTKCNNGNIHQAIRTGCKCGGLYWRYLT